MVGFFQTELVEKSSTKVIQQQNYKEGVQQLFTIALFFGGGGVGEKLYLKGFGCAEVTRFSGTVKTRKFKSSGNVILLLAGSGRCGCSAER